MDSILDQLGPRERARALNQYQDAVERFIQRLSRSIARSLPPEAAGGRDE